MAKKGVVEKVKSYRPLEDRVVIRRLDRGDKSEGGLIHIPDVAQEDRRIAEVVAVGPGYRTDQGVLIEPNIKVGDLVLTQKCTGSWLECGGEELLVLREREIFAVVEI